MARPRSPAGIPGPSPIHSIKALKNSLLIAHRNSDAVIADRDCHARAGFRGITQILDQTLRRALRQTLRQPLRQPRRRTVVERRVHNHGLTLIAVLQGIFEEIVQRRDELAPVPSHEEPVTNRGHLDGQLASGGADPGPFDGLVEQFGRRDKFFRSHATGLDRSERQ